MPGTAWVMPEAPDNHSRCPGCCNAIPGYWLDTGVIILKIEGVGKPEGCKLIRISAEIENKVIMSIQIRGDFFASPEEGFDAIEKKLPGTKTVDLGKRFNELLTEDQVEVFGISGEGLDAVLRDAREILHG